MDLAKLAVGTGITKVERELPGLSLHRQRIRRRRSEIHAGPGFCSKSAERQHLRMPRQREVWLDGDPARPVDLRAWVIDSAEDRATVEAEISSDGVATATGRDTFVAVRPDHPAFDRW